MWEWATPLWLFEAESLLILSTIFKQSEIDCGWGLRNIRQKRRFNVGSFYVRGLTEDTKKEQLVRDVNQYGVDVCALQETKMENAGIHRVNESIIITFDSKNRQFGNGFVVPKNWLESIHKYWRESDRICVLQLSRNPDTCANGPQYECK